MTNRSQSLASGISVLGLTGIICKLVGVLYSIPLARILGDQGLGVFQTVFPTYNLLLTLSSAGLPVAVSRMVAHYLAKEERTNAKASFSIALVLLSSIGGLFSLLMFLSNNLLVRLVGVEEASLGFYVISPCVAIVCVLSAFRGFIQGQQNMIPTAVSQLIEQVGKVIISLPLAALGMKHSMSYGAAGALLGITIIETIALLYMFVRYLVTRNSFHAYPQREDGKPVPRSFLAGRLITISVPITISACIIPLAQFIDSALMVNRMVESGLDRSVATSLYGIFSGMVIRLINIPTALALAISMSLVPAVSSAKAVEDHARLVRESSNGIRFAFLIGFPCAIGMSLLSKQILSFFYLETLSADRLQTAAELLSVSALTVVLFTVVQATSSILQGMHRQKIPMYTMIAGVTCKIALNYILIGTPGIHIHGGPVASLVCYSVAMIPNLYFCCKYAEMPFQWSDWILKPGGAVLAMGLCVTALRYILPEGRIFTIAMIIIGVLVYLGTAFLLKAITKDDLRSMLRH